uniref:Complement component 4 binding protein alpha n=1 Tax=Catagonus wagneri TaxID=51154 RepID=A0A8C3VIE5_9CETA
MTVTDFPRALVTILQSTGTVASWPFFRWWRVSNPILFQVILVAALLATVLGKCGPPPYLQFASLISELNETEFETGTNLNYNCRPGYRKAISRNSFLTCDSRGTWSYKEFCVKRMCGNPGELLNGQVKVKTDYSFGSEIEFSCSEGYVLVGPTTSYCEIQEKGVGWSEHFPRCTIVKCEPPPAISNGKHNGGEEDFYTYGSSVTYSCDPDFSMLGQASISCSVENGTIGVWSPSPPTCKKITCLQPVVKDGIITSGFRPIYAYKESILFGCNKGFRLKGSNLIHCEADSNWSPPPPICELNACAGLPDIPHATWRRYGYHQPIEDVYDIDTVMRYSCLPGYRPKKSGFLTVTCQRDLKWSPYTECVEVCCPIPDVDHINITSRKKDQSANHCTYFYGDEVSYSCHADGKDMYVSSCSEQGSWRPRMTCVRGCDNPPAIAHGYHTIPTTIFGTKKDEAVYKCDEGYTLVGEEKLFCHSSRWSPAAPQCKAQCLKPVIDHGKLSVDQDEYVEHEIITVQCDSGYGLVGSQSIACTENRTWHPQVPKCEWEYLEGCEPVREGKKLMQCLPNLEEIKLALELYKLSLEIKLLKRQIDEKASLELQV